MREGSRLRARAANAVVPFPRRSSPFPRDRALPGHARRGQGNRLKLTGLVPSGRSILLGLAILILATVSYAVARGTSAFAVSRVTVEGPPRHVEKQVEDALAGTFGQSLLALDLPALRAAAENVPTVASASFDRSFPHTLRVVVVPERPVAVLRQGTSSWLVAASGRVIRALELGDREGLPRLWLTREVEVRVGQHVGGVLRDAVRVVAPLARAPLPATVASLRNRGKELTLVLRSGREVRLGDGADRALKLELARRLLPRLTEREIYLDVSVPERPVAGSLNSQVELDSKASSLP